MIDSRREVRGREEREIRGINEGEGDEENRLMKRGRNRKKT